MHRMKSCNHLYVDLMYRLFHFFHIGAYVNDLWFYSKLPPKIGGSKELFSDNDMIRILQLFHQYYFLNFTECATIHFYNIDTTWIAGCIPTH